MDSEAIPDPGRLLRLARQGDREALGELLCKFKPYLSVLARIQLINGLPAKVDVSDVVQETFLDALRDFGAFRGTTEREIIHWLRGILACNLADTVRRFCGTQRRDLRLERRQSCRVTST